MASAKETMAVLAKKYPHEPTFLQAVEECAEALAPILEGNTAEADRNRRCFAAMVEPERLLQFRVTWRNAAGALEHNRGWRVQFNSALGPYKGGLRFHPTVTADILKFLGFEQVFNRAGQECEIPNFKGSSLGRFPLVSADFWTSDHLLERPRSVDDFSGTRARGTLTLKRT